MTIYYRSFKAQRYGHRMTVAPAGDKAFVKSEVPADWVDADNNPIQFEVVFNAGRGDAEVDDRLGRYMVERGLASKTFLLQPNPDDAGILAASAV